MHVHACLECGNFWTCRDWTFNGVGVLRGLFGYRLYTQCGTSLGVGICPSCLAAEKEQLRRGFTTKPKESTNAKAD